KVAFQKGSTVYFAANTQDSVGAESALSPQTSIYLAIPGPITDLIVTNYATTATFGAAPVNITLQWTMPGNDGTTGNIVNSSYDLRWSLVPILNFTNYQNVVSSSIIVSTNVAPGTIQSATVNGLVPNSTYYFAVTVKNSLGVRTSLSNGATALGFITVLVGAANDNYAVAWGDYDGDGDLDLSAASLSNLTETLFRNDGAGKFTITTSFNGTSGYTHDLAWADVDNDGDLDVAFCNYYDGGTWLVVPKLMRNDGNGVFFMMPNATLSESYCRSIA